jgi:hypothetical protein
MPFEKGNRFGLGNLPKVPWNKGKGVPYREAFSEHKYNALLRGIPFELTFEEWLQIWNASGKLDRRGRGVDKYVMARNGDAGPYKVGNVRIILGTSNRREWQPTQTQKLNHATSLLGNKNKLGKKESPLTKRRKRRAVKLRTRNELGRFAREYHS